MRGSTAPLLTPSEQIFQGAPAPAVELAPEDPALIVFTSGTAGEPKPIRHGHRYLFGQRVQAEHWFGAMPGELAWCTAASGWSKSARNSFIAPWLRGATALLHDARFDADERLDVDRARARGRPVHGAHRVPRDRQARRPAGPPRPASRRGRRRAARTRRSCAPGRRRPASSIHDGYGQTETGALTGMPLGAPRPAGVDGSPAARLAAVGRRRRALRGPRDRAHVLHSTGPAGTWRTGDRVRQDEDGYLWFEGRTDDVIISAGYRIGPFEVESALVAHPAVAEAAVVAAPDEERGSVVRAVVVLRDGFEPGDDAGPRAAGPRKGRRRPTSTRASSSSRASCRRPRAGKIRRAALRTRQA